MTQREAVDATIAALDAGDRPALAGLVHLARLYADAIDEQRIDGEGLDPLARYGPKLAVVLRSLHTLAEPAAGEQQPAAAPASSAEPTDFEAGELAAMRRRRAGDAG